MWILLRIIAAVCGLLYRYIAAFGPIGTSRRSSGINFFDKQRKNKRGDVTYHRIGVRLPVNICVAFTRESGTDRFFKRIGFSQELQTGDHTFDERIYIASDHLELGAALRDAEPRKHIQGMLTGGFDRIWSNGQMLYASSRRPVDTARWVPRLDRIRSALADVATSAPGRFSEPFFWRALVVESILWCMAGYAVVAVFEHMFHRQRVHLDRGHLFLYGAAAAAAIALALLALIVLFLKRSARSHRILTESALLLVLATPVFGVQVVADINRSSDESRPMVVRSQVRRHWREEHRSRKGTTYSYHVEIAQIEGEVPLPDELEVSSAVYYTLADGAVIPIEMGRGRLGLLWYKSINGVPVE